MNLVEIDKELGQITDKQRKHHYLEDYDKLLAPLRDTAKHVLEIGIDRGGSLRLWERYFSNATILGIDVEKSRLINEGRINSMLGDSRKIKLETEFDLIVEDGDHSLDAQIQTFNNLFPRLRAGGIYCLEDIQGYENLEKLKKSVNGRGQIEVIDHSAQTKKWSLALLVRKTLSGCVVITPTGDRPQTLKILRECLERQTVQPQQWIVVDDGDISSEHIVAGFPGLTYIRRTRTEHGHTLRFNLLAGLPHISKTASVISVMEDDDWYAANYLEEVKAKIGEACLLGYANRVYFNLKDGSVKKFRSAFGILALTSWKHAITPEIIKVTETVTDHGVDGMIWKALKGKLLEQDGLHAGIKGCPGRQGLLPTHNASPKPFQDWSPLQNIVGTDIVKYKTLNDKIDIVFPLRDNGSTYELKMALRSIEKNFLNLGKIYVVTANPLADLPGVIRINFSDSDKEVKDANLINKIRAACNLKELSENFIFWSDDQVLLRPLSAWELKPVYHGYIDLNSDAKTKWQRRLKHTGELCKQITKGKPVHWDSHVPQPFNKKKFLEVTNKVDYRQGGLGVTICSYYFNLTGQRPVVLQKTVKHTQENSEAVSDRIHGKTWLGYNDNGLKSVQNWLDSTFPAPSKFEATQ